MNVILSLREGEEEIEYKPGMNMLTHQVFESVTINM